MLRRFNYTGRRKLKRSAVAVTLRPDGARPPSFDAQIDLSDLQLPGHGRVYVEAYHKASYMRFDFGTVDELRPQGDRSLTEIDGGASALFRVKVVDESDEHGRVLAEADGITPIDGEETPADRIPLLPVITKDLRQAVWQLDFSDGRPALLLNKEIEGISQMARNDDRFFTLVYPTVLQRILFQILRVEEESDIDGDPDDWRIQWLQFACRIPGVAQPPRPPEGTTNDDDTVRMRQLDWIDDAVAAFCDQQDVCNRFVRTLNGGNN